MKKASLEAAVCCLYKGRAEFLQRPVPNISAEVGENCKPHNFMVLFLSPAYGQY